MKWYKNGAEVQVNATTVTTAENNRVALALAGATDADAGRYTCTARNPAGTASSTADLVVRRKQFPPVFGRRLQAQVTHPPWMLEQNHLIRRWRFQVVRPGSRVTMEIEVTGTPLPEVKWFKDGLPGNFK